MTVNNDIDDDSATKHGDSHSGYNHTHVKQKLHRKRRRACKSSWSRIGSLKSFTLTILWNSAKHLKIFPGIVVRQLLTVQRQNGTGERAMRSVKEGTSAVMLQPGLDEKWLVDSMECYLSDGKTP